MQGRLQSALFPILGACLLISLRLSEASAVQWLVDGCSAQGAPLYPLATDTDLALGEVVCCEGGLNATLNYTNATATRHDPTGNCLSVSWPSCTEGNCSGYTKFEGSCHDENVDNVRLQAVGCTSFVPNCLLSCCCYACSFCEFLESLFQRKEMMHPSSCAHSVA